MHIRFFSLLYSHFLLAALSLSLFKSELKTRLPISIMTPLVLSLACLMAISLLTTPIYSEDLLQVIQAVKKNDPTWKASQYAYQSGKQAKGIGRAFILPNLSFNGEHKSVRDQIECTNGLNNCSEQKYNSTSYQVELVQPLFNVEKWRTYKTGRADFDNAEIEYQNAHQNLLFEITTLYFDVLRAQEIYLLSRAEHNSLILQLKQIQAKADAGVVDQTEVIESQASHDLAVANRITQFGLLKIAFENLATRSGIEKPSVMSLSEGYPMTSLEPSNEEAWVAKAKKNSLSLKSMEQSVEIARRTYKKNTAKVYPQVDLFASLSDREQEGGQFVQNGSSEAIGIRLSVPIFVGLGDFYTAKEQKLKYFETNSTIEAQKQEFLQNVKSRFRSTYTNQLQVQARKISITSSERALRAIELQYDLGSRNMSDVLQAQQNLFSAKQKYAEARYNYLIDKLQLELLVGELEINDIMEVNNWLVVDNSLISMEDFPK